MIAVRVTTARKLMHAKPEGRSNRQERGPHRSREQARILKEVGTLKAALISVGKPGQASTAAMQCLAEFGIMPTVEDCAERNDRVPPERTAV